MTKYHILHPQVQINQATQFSLQHSQYNLFGNYDSLAPFGFCVLFFVVFCVFVSSSNDLYCLLQCK